MLGKLNEKRAFGENIIGQSLSGAQAYGRNGGVGLMTKATRMAMQDWT
ncbi:MAG TPA: hypothetical protein VFQ25_15955 [Ktedonobacterales bacterium]|nr:hypothetical protein [Ktedonobacterales bacterium]